MHGLSLVAASGGYSSLWYVGFSLRWLLLLRSTGSRDMGFSSSWLAGSRAQGQKLWHTGLVASWHVESSWTRARTRIPCICRQILNHCATREVHSWGFDIPGNLVASWIIIYIILVFKNILFSYWGIIDIQHNISFRCQKHFENTWCHLILQIAL